MSCKSPMLRARRSIRVTISTSPSRRKSSTVRSSSRPSVVVPDRFSDRIVPQAPICGSEGGSDRLRDTVSHDRPTDRSHDNRCRPQGTRRTGRKQISQRRQGFRCSAGHRQPLLPLVPRRLKLHDITKQKHFPTPKTLIDWFIYGHALSGRGGLSSPLVAGQPKLYSRSALA